MLIKIYYGAQIFSGAQEYCVAENVVFIHRSNEGGNMIC